MVDESRELMRELPEVPRVIIVAIGDEVEWGKVNMKAAVNLGRYME